jgi:hypothetical protein
MHARQTRFQEGGGLPPDLFPPQRAAAPAPAAAEETDAQLPPDLVPPRRGPATALEQAQVMPGVGQAALQGFRSSLGAVGRSVVAGQWPPHAGEPQPVSPAAEPWEDIRQLAGGVLGGALGATIGPWGAQFFSAERLGAQHARYVVARLGGTWVRMRRARKTRG